MVMEIEQMKERREGERYKSKSGRERERGKRKRDI